MDRKFVERVTRAFESRHESEQAAKADCRSGARDAIAWRMLALSDEGLAHLAIAADARLRADARGRDGGVRQWLAAGVVEADLPGGRNQHPPLLKRQDCMPRGVVSLPLRTSHGRGV